MYFDKTERITRDQLPGYAQKPKRKGNTRSPLKDLARSTQQAECAVYPGDCDIRLTLPIRAVSELNQHEHWTSTHKRKKIQQDIVKAAWIGFRVNRDLLAKAFPHRFSAYHVRFTRIGPKRIDPGNIEGSFKWIQDAVCEMLGIDDGSDLITFEYHQEVIGRREYEVRVEISSKGEPCHEK